MCVCVRACVLALEYVCLSLGVCMYVCARVCMCICVCVGVLACVRCGSPSLYLGLGPQYSSQQLKATKLSQCVREINVDTPRKRTQLLFHFPVRPGSLLGR